MTKVIVTVAIAHAVAAVCLLAYMGLGEYAAWEENRPALTLQECAQPTASYTRVLECRSLRIKHVMDVRDAKFTRARHTLDTRIADALAERERRLDAIR